MTRTQRGSGQVHGESHPAARLTAEKVTVMRRALLGMAAPLRRGFIHKWAKRFGVTASAVSLAVHGRRWRSLKQKPVPVTREQSVGWRTRRTAPSHNGDSTNAR